MVLKTALTTLTAKVGKFSLIAIVVLAVALGGACLLLKIEQKSHDNTQLQYENAQRSLESLQRTMEQVRRAADIDRQVRDDLAVALAERGYEFNGIQQDLTAEIEAIRQAAIAERVKQGLPPFLAVAPRAPASSTACTIEEVQNGQEASIDYSARAADALINGMWDIYQRSVSLSN